MAQRVEERTSTPLAGLRAALADLLDNDQPLLSGAEQLQELTEGLHLQAQLHTWLALRAARIDATEVTWQEHGTSTATWLADAANLTRREAGHLIHTGKDLRRFPIIAHAAGSGAVLPPQAEAITAVLNDLPDDFPTDTVVEAQQLMVGFAATLQQCRVAPPGQSPSGDPRTRNGRTAGSGPARTRASRGDPQPAFGVQL